VSVDNFFSLVGFAFMFLSNLVAFSVLISRLGARLNFCESEIKSLKVRDDVQADELKTLYKIEGKIELLISYVIGDKMNLNSKIGS
jgi:hypothetical protein